MNIIQIDIRDDAKKEKKDDDDCKILIKGVIGLFNFVTLILLIIWLCKIIKNADDEPPSFADFIANESLKNYTESDFCYGRKFEFSKNGALSIFHIRMKKIKNIL